MKIILSLLVGFFSLSANAALNGNWNGWAYWKYDGDGPKCSAQMAFQETEKNFSMLKGNLDCDIVVMDIPERTFAKDASGALTLDNEPIGKWSENTYEWTERYNERTVIHVAIKVNGTNMDYSERWIEDNEKILYDISGRLFKSTSGF